MSVALMTKAWKSKYGSTAKLVLLALCDNANDQGECYPSVSMLAEKCSLSERAVFKQLDMLELDGAIKRKTRTGRSTVYQLDPCTWFTPEQDSPLNDVHPTPAPSSPPPLNVVHPTPARGSPITIKEPSIEPSRKQKTELLAQLPPSLVSDFLQIRKAKKQPLTETAVNGIQREASKAGISLEDAIRYCCEAGWAGFNAGWYADRKSTKRNTVMDEKRAMVAAFTGKNTIDLEDGNVIAITGY